MNAHAVLAVAAAAAFFVALGTVPHAEPHPGPALVVRVDATAEATPRATPDEEDRAMALAVASIDRAERARVLDQIRYTAARLETRLSPLGTDFDEDDGDPVDAFRRQLSVHVPSFTAAHALTRGAWTAPGLSVRVARSCAEAALAPGEACVPLWAYGSDDEPPIVQRARFVAWAATRAAVFEMATAAAAEGCAAALRSRASDPSSTVALVLTAADLALQPVPERSELQEAARRLGAVMAANHRDDRQHLEAFARATPQGRVAPWLGLSPTALIVVPRLSALARTDALAAEIEAAAGGAPIAWTHRP